MPVGLDSPRMTAFLMASRSMASASASRTRASASGLRSFTDEWRSTFEPTSSPRKMVRFSRPLFTMRCSSAFRRATSWAGTSCRKSTSPDSSAATRVAADLIGTYCSSVTSSGNWPLPQ